MPLHVPQKAACVQRCPRPFATTHLTAASNLNDFADALAGARHASSNHKPRSGARQIYSNGVLRVLFPRQVDKPRIEVPVRGTMTLV